MPTKTSNKPISFLTLITDCKPGALIRVIDNLACETLFSNNDIYDFKSILNAKIAVGDEFLYLDHMKTGHLHSITWHLKILYRDSIYYIDMLESELNKPYFEVIS